MKVYCQKCGSKVEFSANNKPKFCQNCGTSLSLGSNVLKASNQEESDDEESDATSVPRLSKLEVEIQTDQIKGEKIGDMLGVAEGADLPTYSTFGKKQNRYPKAKQSKKEALKNFKKEAGSLRPKGSVNEP